MSGKNTEKIPYGFMKHEKYDVVVMDSEKMESVKLMFSLCLDGMSLGQIKNVIESQGIEYPAKYKKDKKVGWSLAEIRKILSDPIYGNERYNAIAKEELEIARRMLTLNTRVVGKRMEISALVGIAMCKECGSFLVEKSVSTRGRTYLVHAEYSDNIGEDIRNRADFVNGFVTVAAESKDMAQVIAANADVQHMPGNRIQPFLQAV